MNNPSSNASVTACERAVKNRFPRSLFFGTLLMSLVLSSLTLVSSASAATITVGDAGDHPTGNPANCNIASTCTLRDAIAKASNVTGAATGDTIVFSLPANSTITLTGSELFLDRNLTIDANASRNIAIDGDGRSRVINIKENATIALKHVTITNGYNETYGAGISNRGLLVLMNCVVSENVSYSGAGILNFGTASLIDTNVSDNLSSGKYTIGGGAIYNSLGSMTISNSTLSNNSAQGDGGGGGAILNDGYLSVNDSSISDNKSIGPGGAIFNYEHGTLWLTDSIISGNIGGQAGGLQNNGFASLSRVSIVANSAPLGGSIVNTQFGTATIIDSRIINNNSTESIGGGIYNYYGKLNISRSVISYNSSHSDGGGVSNEGILSIYNVTLSNNSANGIGGISDSGLIYIYSKWNDSK